jgi:hypothetical protein
MNLIGFRSKWSWRDGDTVPEFAWRNRGKLSETSVRITGAPDEIRTEHLPNTSLEGYRKTIQIVSVHVCVVTNGELGTELNRILRHNYGLFVPA